MATKKGRARKSKKKNVTNRDDQVLESASGESIRRPEASSWRKERRAATREVKRIKNKFKKITERREARDALAYLPSYEDRGGPQYAAQILEEAGRKLGWSEQKIAEISRQFLTDDRYRSTGSFFPSIERA